MNRKSIISIVIVSFVVASVVFLVSGLAACKTVDTNDTTPGDNNTPTGHTVFKGGVGHMPGLNDPEANCTSCHGSDLRGGTASSCYACHGKKW